MTESLEHLRRWLGRNQETGEVVDLLRARAMQATLDEPPPALQAGDPLPPLWHWLYFWNVADHSALGPDGHPARGQFLPPVALPRRMQAGGRLRFLRPLAAGTMAKRRSTVVDVTMKRGSSGQLVFVTIEHEISDKTGPCLQEEQDIVFRELAKAATPPPRREAAPVVVPWRQQVTPDAVLLFRYSALTFNGHRIHYDQKYATEEEGYPGLVVHGPLLATLMAGLVRKHAPDRQMTAFEYRAVRPVFDTAPFTVGGRPAADGASADLWIADSNGTLAVKGRADLA
jgi:3-methylfumaryl-CoA hydratase